MILKHASNAYRIVAAYKTLRIVRGYQPVGSASKDRPVTMMDRPVFANRTAPAKHAEMMAAAEPAAPAAKETFVRELVNVKSALLIARVKYAEMMAAVAAAANVSVVIASKKES